MIQERIRDFLIDISLDKDWLKLVCKIELQANYLASSGYYITRDKEKIYLETRTSDDFDNDIKTFHFNNSSSLNRWNKIIYSIDKFKNESLSLIWDETGQ